MDTRTETARDQAGGLGRTTAGPRRRPARRRKKPRQIAPRTTAVMSFPRNATTAAPEPARTMPATSIAPRRISPAFCLIAGSPTRALTLEMTGPQHAPRSGCLLLWVRVDRHVRAHWPGRNPAFRRSMRCARIYKVPPTLAMNTSSIASSRTFTAPRRVVPGPSNMEKNPICHELPS